MKKEDKRHKAQLALGDHVVDTSTLPTYSSVMQNLSIRLLLLIAKVNNLKITISDAENACINAKCREKVYSQAESEWNKTKSYILEIVQALCSLKIS